MKEGRFLPSLGLVADVDLPTATGAREACPRVRATAAKSLGAGVLESIRLEGELWTDAASHTPGYRAVLGTTLRLLPGTSGSVELVALRPGIGAGLARESIAQLGLSQRLAADTNLRAGVAAHLAADTSSLQATIGIDRRF